MQVSVLKNVKGFLDDIVDHTWNKWSDDYIELTNIKSKDDMKDFFLHTCKGDTIPICYVLHENDTLYGYCIVDTEDMSMCPHFSPWLSTVYVLPEHRMKGYASFMLEKVLLQYDITLYLWTYNMQLADFYSRFGFNVHDIIPSHGKYTNLILMQRKSLKQ